MACTARRDAQRVAVDSPRRRTRLARPARPACRVDGQARGCASRPVRPRRPVARCGARAGLYRSRRARSPSTERRGSTVALREPSLRCVATANDACRAATDPRRRAAPPCRTEIAAVSPRFGHVSPMFGAKVPSISPNSPNLGEFRMFFEDDRTYSDYMKLAGLGNMKHFTLVISESSRK